MQAINWSSQMTLGIPAIDDTHKALIERLAALANEPDDTFYAGFTALTEAIESDFRLEELLMEQIDFPGLSGHREQHSRVLSALHHADPQVAQGDIKLGRTCIELLPEWFLVHHATMDLALATALDLVAHPLQEQHSRPLAGDDAGQHGAWTGVSL